MNVIEPNKYYVCQHLKLFLFLVSFIRKIFDSEKNEFILQLHSLIFYR